jgi:hypothetical protein
MLSEKTETKSRLLATLIRDMIRAESFASLADLTDALKFRCARLRIPWTPDDISAALQWVGSNRPLVTSEVPPPRPAARTDPDPVGLTRDQASATLARLLRGQPGPIRTMPAARPRTVAQVRAADRVRALTLVLDELLDTARRCETLEQQEPISNDHAVGGVPAPPPKGQDPDGNGDTPARAHPDE